MTTPLQEFINTGQMRTGFMDLKDGTCYTVMVPLKGYSAADIALEAINQGATTLPLDKAITAVAELMPDDWPQQEDDETIGDAAFIESEHPREGGKFTEKFDKKQRPKSERMARATESYNPMNKEKKAVANAMEEKVASVLKGDRTPDNKAFDVLLRGHGIEVKTIIAGRNDKITMHPASLERKVNFAKENGIKASTVVIDARSSRSNPTVYYRDGVGSFRLQGMTRLRTWNDLRSHYR